jgi:hypothetical protein
LKRKGHGYRAVSAVYKKSLAEKKALEDEIAFLETIEGVELISTLR